jgi:hypothetical protein
MNSDELIMTTALFGESILQHRLLHSYVNRHGKHHLEFRLSFDVELEELVSLLQSTQVGYDDLVHNQGYLTNGMYVKCIKTGFEGFKLIARDNVFMYGSKLQLSLSDVRQNEKILDVVLQYVNRFG